MPACSIEHIIIKVQGSGGIDPHILNNGTW